MKKSRYIITELIHHLPYTIFGVSIGIMVMGFLTFFTNILGAEDRFVEASEDLFHVFHPLHVLFSSIATTAMFWKHDNNLVKAISVGFLGSITLCGLSDVIFPFIGGNILGAHMHLHICLINEPMLVYPFAVVGVLAGLTVTKSFEKSTQYSHSAHVFISSMASILYLMGNGVFDWGHVLGGVFFVTLFAVLLPCCLSDIVFPLTCTHRHCTHSQDDLPASIP